MLQQSFAVFLVLALLFVALWLLRRQGLASSGFLISPSLIGRKKSTKRLRVIERLVLTPQHSLHLISIGDQLVVFATSPAGCQQVQSATPFTITHLEHPHSLKSGAAC